MSKALPAVPKEEYIIQDLPDETLVYDLRRHRAHNLNRAAALVWQHCDGTTTFQEMAALLHRELRLPPDERIVRLALAQLTRARLLHAPLMETDPAAERPARRKLMQKLGRAGGLALLLPLVESIVSPVPASAESSCLGRECRSSADCCPQAINCGQDDFGVNRCES